MIRRTMKRKMTRIEQDGLPRPLDGRKPILRKVQDCEADEIVVA
jgi:hypothetical protein